MADKKGPAMFMVMVDVPADKEEEFNHWYNEEHLAELLAVPGVLNAARYEAIRSGPKHLAFYELENADVVRSEAFTSRPTTDWAKRIGPRVIGTNFSNNVYEMIYPQAISSDIAQSDMAPALQIGRMAIPAEHEDEWNKWYSGVYVPNYEKVPGCIRGRRWKAVRGEPKYAVVYEFENERISNSAEWAAQRDIDPDNARMRSLMEHATSSPGIWKKTFQL